MNKIAQKLIDRIQNILQRDLDITINIYVFLAKKGFAQTEEIKSAFKLDDIQVKKHLDRLLEDEFIIAQQFEKEVKEVDENGSVDGKTPKKEKTIKISYFVYRVRSYAEYTWKMDLQEYFG